MKELESGMRKDTGKAAESLILLSLSEWSWTSLFFYSKLHYTIVILNRVCFTKLTFWEKLGIL